MPYTIRVTFCVPNLVAQQRLLEAPGVCQAASEGRRRHGGRQEKVTDLIIKTFLCRFAFFSLISMKTFHLFESHDDVLFMHCQCVNKSGVGVHGQRYCDCVIMYDYECSVRSFAIK